MKRIKLFFAVVACALIMCPLFAGCISGGARYCEGSFDFSYKVRSYESRPEKYLDIDWLFCVDVKDAGEYKVTYDISIYGNDFSKENFIKTVSDLYEIQGDGREISTVTGSAFLEMENFSEPRLWIKNVKITKVKNSDELKGYAIGFGVAGGVLLCGVTAYFIVEKTVISKRKEK